MSAPPPSTVTVPEEQQPLFQYEELSQSFFSRWPALSLTAYLKGILGVWLGALVLVGPIAAGSFSPERDPLAWLGVATVGCNGILGLVLLRLYLGWRYVQRRLVEPEVLYEESGWYDGATCPKSPEELVQHTLIVEHQIKPIVQRLHRTFGIMAAVSGAAMLLWLWH
ncbi:MAG: CGLD27 family protein [Synechococcaceae cyanobacterium SM2_3_2]|nr:CGLD27 family protein [Synechococcaceae cyanobacterium SM2_3_2]